MPVRCHRGSLRRNEFSGKSPRRAPTGRHRRAKPDRDSATEDTISERIPRSIDRLQRALVERVFEMTFEPRRCCRNRVLWVVGDCPVASDVVAARTLWHCGEQLFATPRRTASFARTPRRPLHLLLAGETRADACSSRQRAASCRKLTESSLDTVAGHF